MKSRLPAFLVGFVIPFVLMVVMMPIYNRIEPVVFGFPFMYFWIFAGMFVTSLCLLIAFRIDPKNKGENED